MGALHTLSTRPQLRVAALLLLLTAILAAALAAAAPAIAATLALLVAVGVATLGLLATAAGRPARATPKAEIPSETAPPVLRLTLPSGETVAARQVALGETVETAMLLTRDGYVVVDERGRVLYRL